MFFNQLLSTIMAGPGDTIIVNGGTISDVDFTSPYSASSQVVYNTDGTIDTFRTVNPDNADVLGDWIDPLSSAPGDYQIRATLNSGSVDGTSSSTGTWLALTSARQWKVSQPASGSASANLTIEIRKGTGPALDSGTIILEATGGF